MASNCFNEFPGDWKWSCRGLVQMEFRNPSFWNDVLRLPAVPAATSAAWAFLAAHSGHPQTHLSLALHSPGPGSHQLPDLYDPSLGLPGWADLDACWWTQPSWRNEDKQEKVRGKDPSGLQLEWSVFRLPWSSENLSLHSVSKALSFYMTWKFSSHLPPSK